jgi:hypothetical protein
MTAKSFGRWESVMGQLGFATDRPAILVSRSGNVLPFDAQRRSSRPRETSAVRPGVPEGVLVRFPLANGARRRSEEAAVDVNAKSSDGSEQRFTPFDYVATAVLILSVFAAPALVWTLLRTASFG